MIQLLKSLYTHFVHVNDPERLTAIRVLFTLLLLILWGVVFFL